MIEIIIQFFLLIVLIFVTAWYSSILVALRRAEKTSNIAIPKFWKIAIPVISLFAFSSILFMLMELGFAIFE